MECIFLKVLNQTSRNEKIQSVRWKKKNPQRMAFNDIALDTVGD